MKSFEKFFPYFLLAGILINANGLLTDILEPDGALYATLAKHIAVTNEWMNLFGDGHDWLDKPHFPFWVTAASFKIFGINAFAYKLPGFVFWLTGTWFTYLLAKDLYNERTAKIAVIVYIFSLHGILTNFDVRAEPFLTALSVAAIFFMRRASNSGSWKYIFLTALLSACAVMTKGIFMLITIFSGFVIYWIVSGQWKQFINYRWWLLIVLILLFITPELYSLYTQFDLHPEKIVFGKTNVSGLKFFFWDSQFGRFFNTGPIKGTGDPSFFLHTTLWAFLPFSVVLYIAVIQLFRRKNFPENKGKWIVYGSALVTFLMFSLSKFQLPFYIVIVFPQFAIITAAYLGALNRNNSIKKIAVFQYVLLCICGVFVCALAFYSHIGNSPLLIALAVLIISVAFYFYRSADINRIIAPGVAFSLVLFLFLHNFFYPNLLKYQSGTMAVNWMKNNNLNNDTPAMFRFWSYTFEFHAHGLVKRLQSFDDVDNYLQQEKSNIIYTSIEDAQQLVAHGYSCRILQSFPDFHVSMLTPAFINPVTRPGELKKIVLLSVQKK